MAQKTRLVALAFVAAVNGCDVAGKVHPLPQALQPQPVGTPSTPTADDPTTWLITKIKWYDGDSGEINGQGFRLSDVDAPESRLPIGGRGRARCAKEHELGIQATNYMYNLTDTALIKISAVEGYDKMEKPRLLVRLTADGQDIGDVALSAGVLRPWPHDGPKALQPKPDWCA